VSADEERQRPVVTVSDPGRAGMGADVLGSDEPAPRGPRWLRPVVVGAVLGGLLTPAAVTAVREQRQESRAEAAAEADRQRDDEAAVRLLDPAVEVTGAPSELAVLVTATVRRGARAVVVDRMRLTGTVFEGSEAQPVSGVVDPAEAPARVRLATSLDCGAVARAFSDGPRPTGASVVLTVTPRSGRQRDLPPFPLPDAALQDGLLGACSLGDPAVLPTAAAAAAVRGSGSDGRDVVLLVSVGNGEAVAVTDVRWPGVALRRPDLLPFQLRRNEGVQTDLVVTGVDCERLGTGPVVVVLRRADVSSFEVEAGALEQPDVRPLDDLVAELRAERC
jgi:hypothetical protein